MVSILELARKRSNFDGKPSLHPERKGQLNRSKLKNWVEKNGGLPTYINSLATGILRSNPTWTIGRVIATAVNMAKKMCAGGATGIVKKVSAAVKAAACKAVAQWEAKKAKASEDWADAKLIELSETDHEDAVLRERLRNRGVEIPEQLMLSDDDYFMLTEGDEWEEVNEDLDIDKYLEFAEAAAYADAKVRLPVFSEKTNAVELSENQWKKEILKVGKIKYNGREIEFTPEFLKEMKHNYEKGVIDYVPLQFVNEQNGHSDDPRLFGGTVQKLELDDEDNPTSLNAIFKLEEDALKAVRANPAVGASIKAHPNYVDPDDNHHGATLLHVAMTPRPRLKALAAWEPIAASEQGDTIDLTEADYVAEEVVEATAEETVVEETTTTPEQEETNMAEAGNTTINLTELLENPEFKSQFELAVSNATASKDQEIERLQTRLGTVEEKSYAQAVELAVDSYADAGVPKAIRDVAQSLMMSLSDVAEDEVVELTEGEGDAATQVKVTPIEAVTRILDECKGYVNLTAETGSSADVEEDGALEGESKQKAVKGLVALARANKS